MPELDLSNAQALRVAGRDIQAVRIANINVWETPNPFIDTSVFGNESPASDHFEPFEQGNDLGIGGWAANAFYTYGSPYPGATIIGLRYWVEEGSPIIGEGIKIGLFQSEIENEVGWGSYTPGQVLQEIAAGEALKEYPAGTLQAGWNELRFDAEWPVNHYSYFAVGVSIGDGTKYQYASELKSEAYRSRDLLRLNLSEDYEPFHRGLFHIGGDSWSNANWTPGHYGLDVMVRIPLTPQLYEHSIWVQDEPTGEEYETYGGLGVGGWTTSHFYLGNPGPETQEGWQLVGARLWVPPAERDVTGVVGVMARCSYYIKTSGYIKGDEDSPQAIIEAIEQNNPKSIALTRGWNVIYFDEPVEVPLGAGIAIGWQIGTGDTYVSEGITAESVQSIDHAPIWLAASSSDSFEMRGAFRENGVSNWSYQNNHYGGDIIMREPTNNP